MDILTRESNVEGPLRFVSAMPLVGNKALAIAEK
jgi:hypothetical protein